MSNTFIINGGKKLEGEVTVSGFKNAALPILAASLIVKGKSTIKNLPQISDVDNFLDILESLGADIKRLDDHSVEICTDKVKAITDINHEGILKMRAAILLIGPLLARFKEVKIPFPGGCVLGRRSADTHLSAFVQMGAKIIESKEYIHLKIPKNNKTKKQRIIMPEMSVTATENAMIYASYLDTETEIRLAAVEPHVKNLCEFLKDAGAKIKNLGTHNVTIKGGNLKNAHVRVRDDMLEAGAYILAAALTKGDVLVKNVPLNDLDIFFLKLEEIGVNFEIDHKKNTVRVKAPLKTYQAVTIKTAVFPGFPTDLMSPFVTLLTQCKGVSRVFERLFEGRFAFLFELEKMGAHVELLNPHQAIIIGKTPLKGATVASQDIRAGAAVLLAALCAKGKSEVTNINYIFRGYEKIMEKLQKLGADIKLKE